MSEPTPYCTLEDVETFLKHKTPGELVEFAERKIMFASNTLRMMKRHEGNDLDEEAQDPVMKAMLRDTVASNIADDLRKEESKMEDDTDLSSFNQFTQTVGNVSFSGTFAGSTTDVFFTTNQLRGLGIGLSTISRFSLFSDKASA